MTPADRVTPAQERAIAALVGGASLQEAALAAKVSDRTLRRWRRQDEAFKARLGEAQMETYAVTINRVVTASTTAIATLVKIASNEKTAPAARVAASVAILNHAHNSYKSAALEARLDQLEEALSEQS